MNQQDWLLFRKRLLRQVKRWVQLRLGKNNFNLGKYQKNFEDEFKGRWKSITEDQFLKHLGTKKLIFGADFHAYAQSQRAHLRILRKLDKTIHLALECFESKDQELIDLYMQDKLNDEQFLKQLKWEERWGFSWDYYKPLIELAKSRGWNVHGINVYLKGVNLRLLRKRDQWASKKIAALLKKYPDDLIFVLFGELHVAQKHLPRSVLKASKNLSKKDIALIHLDNEKLYFKHILESKKEESIYLTKNLETFCVLSSPPWLKWQSYLLHLEGENEVMDDLADWNANFSSFWTVVVKDLELEDLPPPDIQVYRVHDDELWALLEEKLNSVKLKRVHDYIKLGKSFYLPELGVGVLCRPTVNHMAVLVGEYLQSRLSKRRGLTWQMPEEFFNAVWIETLSFFISRLINPHRKSANVQKMPIESERVSKTVLKIVLKHSIDIRNRKKIEFKKFNIKYSWSSYILASKLLGSIYGSKMHQAFRRGKLNKDDIYESLSLSVESKNFLDFYNKKLMILERFDQNLQNKDR